MSEKTCTKCNQEKPLEEFFKKKDCVGGRCSYCKDCKKIMSGKWRKKNKNGVKEQQKIRTKNWGVNNVDKLTDLYLAKKIVRQSPELSRIEVLKNKDLLELKRSEILIYRLTRKINDYGKK